MMNASMQPPFACILKEMIWRDVARVHSTAKCRHPTHSHRERANVQFALIVLDHKTGNHDFAKTSLFGSWSDSANQGSSGRHDSKKFKAWTCGMTSYQVLGRNRNVVDQRSQAENTLKSECLIRFLPAVSCQQWSIGKEESRFSLRTIAVQSSAKRTSIIGHALALFGKF
jgi:hypothetical protein